MSPEMSPTTLPTFATQSAPTWWSRSGLPGWSISWFTRSQNSFAFCCRKAMPSLIGWIRSDKKPGTQFSVSLTLLRNSRIFCSSSWNVPVLCWIAVLVTLLARSVAGRALDALLVGGFCLVVQVSRVAQCPGKVVEVLGGLAEHVQQRVLCGGVGLVDPLVDSVHHHIAGGEAQTADRLLGPVEGL